MITRYFNIADMTVKIESDDVEIQKELDDFEINVSNEICEDVLIQIKKEMPFFSGQSIIDTDEISIFEDSESYIVSYKEYDYVFGYRIYKDDNKTVIYVYRDGIVLRDTKNVELVKEEHKALAGEHLLYSIRDAIIYYAQKKGFIAVHASSLIYKDKLYAFLAESGGGKSTHLLNWLQSDIDCKGYNGDMLLLKPLEDKVLAYGCPWCGTSKLYSTDIVQAAGAFFIHKCKDNYVKEIDKVDKVICLNARAISPNWNREMVALNVEACKKLTELINVNELYCTADESSAYTLRDYIDERNTTR